MAATATATPLALARSLARFPSVLLFASVFCFSLSLLFAFHPSLGMKEKKSAKLPFSYRGFSLLLKHTLSFSLLLLLLVFFSFPLLFSLTHHSSSISSGKHALRSHFLVRLPVLLFLFFFFSRVVSSRALLRRPDLFLARLLSRTVVNKCIECKLPTNFFLDSCLFALCMSANMYISIRRHLLSAFS